MTNAGDEKACDVGKEGDQSENRKKLKSFANIRLSLRTANKSDNEGNPFLGCIGYPLNVYGKTI